jgi:hypothetical protein
VFQLEVPVEQRTAQVLALIFSVEAGLIEVVFPLSVRPQQEFLRVSFLLSFISHILLIVQLLRHQKLKTKNIFF